MPLIDQIQKDMVAAMKAREEQRLSTLRMVKTALKNKEIDKMAPLDDKESQQVLSTLIKQRRDSVVQFTKGGRQEMADKEAAEIKLIETYLPKAAGEEEIVAGVRAAIAEMTPAPAMKDIGTVMKAAMARFAAAGMRVDGKVVSEAVKKELMGKWGSLSPLPLPIHFPLADPALFRNFLQRGFFVGLFCDHDFADPLSNAHGLRCGRSCPLYGFRDQQRDFAFDLSSRFQLIQNFFGPPAEEFFVKLGHLAGDDHVAVAPQNFDHIRQRFQQPVRSFVEYLRSRRVFLALEQLPALSRFGREETAEAERIGGQAACDQRRQEGRRAGNWDDRYVMPDGQRDQAESGVGDAGHARVGDQSDLGSAFEVDDEFGGFGHLVVLVIADGARLDAVMAEEFQGLARVFAGDQVNFLEHAQGAQCDVLEVADGCSNEIERRASYCCALFGAVTILLLFAHEASLARKPSPRRHRGTEEPTE